MADLRFEIGSWAWTHGNFRLLTDQEVSKLRFELLVRSNERVPWVRENTTEFLLQYLQISGNITIPGA